MVSVFTGYRTCTPCLPLLTLCRYKDYDMSAHTLRKQKTPMSWVGACALVAVYVVSVVRKFAFRKYIYFLLSRIHSVHTRSKHHTSFRYIMLMM